jgi:hypothetical protein
MGTLFRDGLSGLPAPLLWRSPSLSVAPMITAVEEFEQLNALDSRKVRSGLEARIR